MVQDVLFNEKATATEAEEPSPLTHGELTVMDTVPPTHIRVGDMENVPESANAGVVAHIAMAKPKKMLPPARWAPDSKSDPAPFDRRTVKQLVTYISPFQLKIQATIPLFTSVRLQLLAKFVE